MIQVTRIIGTRIATTNLIGVEIETGVVFDALILGVVKNSSLRG